MPPILGTRLHTHWIEWRRTEPYAGKRLFIPEMSAKASQGRGKMTKHCWAALIYILLTIPCGAQIKDPIQIDTGLISGISGRDASVRVFKEIPYAKATAER